MKTFEFKTNINCGGCVAAVKPFLNNAPEILEWHVATADPQKLLIVKTAQLNAEQIQELVAQAGFKAVPK